MKKSVLKYIAAPFIGGAIGLLLLFAVSLIPQSMVQNNASASAHHLAADHITPKYINIWDWSYASDNHTDTLIMMESYNLDSFQDALLNPYRGVQKYEGEDSGMPDFETSSLMEKVQELLEATFRKDPVAVLTGIFTGDDERNWIFYTLSTHIFGRKLNEALAEFPVLPLEIYCENDELWEAYDEMCEAEIKLD